MMNELDSLVTRLFKGRSSSFMAIQAPKEYGKTAFVLWIMEQLHRLGLFRYFGLNQEIENAPFEYDFITDLQTLKERCKTLGKRYFYFLDELGKTAPRAIPYNKLNLELIQELEVIRKYRLTLAGCTIGNVDRRIISPQHLDYFIEKTDLTHATIYDFRRKDITKIRDISNTSIKFHEYKVAGFTLQPTNPTFENPLFERFRKYKEGGKASEIWGHPQEKKRDIIKLYEYAITNSHI